ncbi:MAG: sugar ABC transporter substrate-binding protein [Pirellulales bacterium]|nr:sugar ABC transporter substrate-binding protein [Pirellulales bacterium]
MPKETSGESHQRGDQATRRGFLEHALGGAGLGLAALTAGCAASSAPSSAAGGTKPLRALFSNAGLQSTWCALGKQTAELWGKLLGVEVVWRDGEFDPAKQRERIELALDDDWDFCSFQAIGLGSLEAPVRRLKERGIPVISMDTLVVPLAQARDVGVWLQVGPDQQFMGETSTRYLMNKIGGRGRVIHIGGLSAHSGAQGRQAGFDKVLAEHPEVEVVGGGIRWCDWDKQKARDAFEGLLASSDTPIAGAFFHSDDMALACVPALKGTPHEQMVVTAVDGQKEGLDGISGGRLAATTVNPVCLIHMTALVLGQFIVRGAEKLETLPPEIVTPGPLVSRESGNLEAQRYLSDPRHCLV